MFISQDALSAMHIVPSGKRPISILHDINGIIRPGRMSLLLGPPGSGKQVYFWLLLALARKLDSTLKRTSAYIGQHDVHVGEMTVREALKLSARCQGVGTRYDMLTELSRREKEANIKPDPDIDVYMKAISVEGQESVVTEYYILKILGLEICADTMVGDSMIRGEMLVGPAKALFMDGISTGLDSSTMYQIINSLRQSVHILGGTAQIALLLKHMSSSMTLFSSPRAKLYTRVLVIMSSNSLRPWASNVQRERKGVADFLQEVTSRKDQHQYWCRRDEPYRYISVNDFAEPFKAFHVGRKLGSELKDPFDRTRNHPAALTTSKYVISKMELLRACFSREWLLMKRNSFVYIFKVVQVCILLPEFFSTFEFGYSMLNSS
ncbi:hypothetical protein U9M48_025264 [Paspalum notatum var. saurae]|uniref:Uncharacterized protein n=1 Tax=Paspalum notatum var. saurae TaxID=547442 RepID=A0AAQ3TS73_PASNO